MGTERHAIRSFSIPTARCWPRTGRSTSTAGADGAGPGPWWAVTWPAMEGQPAKRCWRGLSRSGGRKKPATRLRRRMRRRGIWCGSGCRASEPIFCPAARLPAQVETRDRQTWLRNRAEGEMGRRPQRAVAREVRGVLGRVQR